jgi:two-component sensor histidine kinase
MRKNPNARISLSVRDNGVGIAPGLDLHRAKSLGLEIVRTLARQLRGSLDVRVQEGTEFTLEFDDEPDQALR